MSCACPTCHQTKLFILYLTEECGASEMDAAITLSKIHSDLIHTIPLPIYGDILSKTAQKIGRTTSLALITSEVAIVQPIRFPKPFDLWVKAKEK